MYLQHFGLRRSPFTADPDPSLFHPLRAHTAAIDELADALRRPEVAQLLGADGAGKTMLLKLLASEVRERVQIAIVGRAARAQGGLYDAIARAFGVQAGGNVGEVRFRVDAYLRSLQERGVRAAVAIDDADTLPDNWLVELHQFCDPETLAVPVILAAQVGVGSRSQLPVVAELQARIVHVVTIGELSVSECDGFLRAVLMAAGAQSVDLFDIDASDALHELAEGLPGRVAEIADRALLVAYGRATDRVDLDAALSAGEQLALGRRAPHATRRGEKAAAPVVAETIELHRHGFNESSRPAVEWPLRQVVGGEPYADAYSEGSHNFTASGGDTLGSVSAAGSGTPARADSGPRVVVGAGSSGAGFVDRAPVPTGSGDEGANSGWGIDADTQRELLAGIRRPDRPAWDRAKYDPFRNTMPEPAPFGPEMLAVLSNPHGVIAEWFRVLRLRLEDWTDTQQESSPVVMVTSAEARAGKTFVATNLALLFANEPGHRVLLVEGDMRRPRFESLFGVPSRPGLADVLAGRTELDKAVQFISEVGLYVLPGGRPGNPRDLLSPDRLAPAIREMREAADVVIIDSPSTGPWVDARSLSAAVDGVLMVTRSGSTRAGDLVQSLQTLDRGKLIGAVMNDLEGKQTERSNGDFGRSRG